MKSYKSNVFKETQGLLDSTLIDLNYTPENVTDFIALFVGESLIGKIHILEIEAHRKDVIIEGKYIDEINLQGHLKRVIEL